jgi:hypothetical protein
MAWSGLILDRTKQGNRFPEQVPAPKATARNNPVRQASLPQSDERK